MTYSFGADLLCESFAVLVEEAEGYLYQYSGVNDPPLYPCFGMLPPESTSIVEAHPNGTVLFNFASRGMQKMMMRTLPAAEAVLTEVWRRMREDDKCAEEALELCVWLERETEVFLDKMRYTGPLDAEEIRDLARDSIEPYFAP